jgi:thiamine-phosphate pyrophosphorylase
VARRSGWTPTALAGKFLAGGARFIQIRCKHASSRDFLALSEEIVRRAHDEGAVVIINDRADIARLCGADGVHLGQEDLEPAAARRILGAGAVVGLSTHSADQVRAASRQPVDYIAVGPIFGTSTKETGYRGVGTALVAEAKNILGEAGDGKPVVAIGGITLEQAPAVIQAGATSVAVISDLVATQDPETRVRDYMRVLSEAANRQ